MNVNQLGPVELPPGKVFDPRSGSSVVRRWRGIPTLIESLAAVHKAAGSRIDIQPDDDGQFSTLLATYGAEDSQSPTEPLSTRWRMVTNQIEKKLWDHPKIVAELDKIAWTDDAMFGTANRLKYLIEEFVSGTTTITDADGNAAPLDIPTLRTLVGLCGMNWTVFSGYIQARVRGVESWGVIQFVLRRTMIVAANSSIRTSLENYNRIYTTAQLKTAEEIPTNVKFDMPDGYWLRVAPTTDDSGPDNVVLVQEWWHADRYDAFTFDPAS